MTDGMTDDSLSNGTTEGMAEGEIEAVGLGVGGGPEGRLDPVGWPDMSEGWPDKGGWTVGNAEGCSDS
jgi:hypothetical protein